jgi:peptide/nickel transport system permease protein
MLNFLGNRLLQLIPTLFFVSVMIFLLQHLLPGDPALAMAGEERDPAVIAQIRAEYHLDQPLPQQYIAWIGGVLHGDLGESIRMKESVRDLVLEKLPVTAQLAAMAMIFAIAIGLTAGVLAAVKKDTAWDYAASVLALWGRSTPPFWLGIMLIVLFSVKLGWLPVGGMATIGGGGGVLDILHHLLLPTLALGLFYAAIYARVMRSSMLEVAQLDFVRTARAKGLSRTKVTISHVLRNALLPVVTILGVQMGTVLAGSVVIESVFSWPGIGSLLFDSVSSRNYPVVLGILVLGSLVVIAANIAVDLVYMWLDPRIEIR